jgi:hypothetical protein
MLDCYFARPYVDGRDQIYCNPASAGLFYNKKLMRMRSSLQKTTLMRVSKYMLLMEWMMMDSCHDGPGNAMFATGG